ncbi:hypothetical protein IEQ34_009008 [Dendrobium chrysotoxum]|uniref:Uncharacterized protein n=1 Tax=Dendrobium chrysotoxum TaxID=161865 RepID=A0AAV7H0L6_DENCH|nr:hypothetical protein IEQ34_009008 [Dendrobium chrysotoxum]
MEVTKATTNGDGNNNGHRQGNDWKNSPPERCLRVCSEMLQQQRMRMNGSLMSDGYPMPASTTFASYCSVENTSGCCRIM